MSGYSKKLRPAVLSAIDHVVSMVHSFPPPLPLSLSSYSEDPRLRGFFGSADSMKYVLGKDQNLAGFLKGPDGGAPQVIALMAMQKEEKVILGAEMSGDIIIRDVPKLTVSFDGHRFIDPTPDLEQTSRLLMRRAYDHLLSLALRRLAYVKAERTDLVRRSRLLQAKHNLLGRAGLGFDEVSTNEQTSIAEIEESLGKIEAELNELGGAYNENDAYLKAVADLLSRPEEYLQSKSETIFVNHMGIKQSAAAYDAPELTFNELRNAEGRSLAVIMVSLKSEELGKLS